MVTYRYAANEIRTALRQVYDDADIRLPLVVYWMQIFGDSLKRQHIQKISSGAFLSVFRSVPVERDIDASIPYPFVELPQGIYDYDYDKGIDYITHHFSYSVGGQPTLGSVKFNRITPNGLERLYMREEERPSSSNPYFYRVGERVYLVGIERANIQYVEMGLMTTFDVTQPINLDDAFDFPEHLLSLLKRQILEMGRFVLMVPENMSNDGTSQDTYKQVPSVQNMAQPVESGANGAQ